jgi:chromate transporter
MLTGPERTPPARVGVATIAREWLRIGCTGFGGPPAHIALLRRLCVVERRWLSATDFEDALAAVNLLPGPASTQLAIFCAWRLRGTVGALVGGICFIAPGLAVILALAIVFLSTDPPLWIQGAAAGAGAAVAAVALRAAVDLVPASWARAGGERAPRARWIVYAVAGVVSAATLGPYLVLVLLVCGCLEVLARADRRRLAAGLPLLAARAAAPVLGGTVALVWVALKVGALSYGGGFVIIPLMQADAVGRYHWLTAGQFLNAVALGQITPGPVVQTVAVVGYGAAGLAGGLLAAVVAFSPSFAFVLVGAPHFQRLRSSVRSQAFLTGAGPAAVGAIAGAAVPLGVALSHAWQVGVLGVAAVWLFGLRRGVVWALLGAALLGVVGAALGLPVTS